MSGTIRHNGQIPTDPTTALALLLTVALAGRLTAEQAQALIATGGIAEFALLALRISRGGR